MSAGAPTWPKPDYDFWRRETEYRRWDAAWLCCDREPPPTKRAEVDRKVQRMLERLLTEVPHDNRAEQPQRRHPGAVTHAVLARLQAEHLDRGILQDLVFFSRDELAKWVRAAGIDAPVFLPAQAKANPKPHGNAERFAKSRAEVLGAALSVLAAFPDSEHLEKGLTAAGLLRLVDGKAGLFWPDTQEIPLSPERAVRLIREWLKKAAP